MTKNLEFENPKEAGRSLLIKMDLLKRYFGITARQIYLRAGVDECFANNVLHARKMGKPTLLKIQNTVFYFSHSKKIKQGKKGGDNAFQDSAFPQGRRG